MKLSSKRNRYSKKRGGKAITRPMSPFGEEFYIQDDEFIEEPISESEDDYVEDFTESDDPATTVKNFMDVINSIQEVYSSGDTELGEEIFYLRGEIEPLKKNPEMASENLLNLMREATREFYMVGRVELTRLQNIRAMLPESQSEEEQGDYGGGRKRRAKHNKKKSRKNKRSRKHKKSRVTRRRKY